MNSAAVAPLDRVLHSRSLDHCEKKALWFLIFLYSSSSFSLFGVPYSQIHSWRKGENSFRRATWLILIILFYCLNNRYKIMIKFKKKSHTRNTHAVNEVAFHNAEAVKCTIVPMCLCYSKGNCPVNIQLSGYREPPSCVLYFLTLPKWIISSSVSAADSFCLLHVRKINIPIWVSQWCPELMCERSSAL